MKFIRFYTEEEKNNVSFKQGNVCILPVQIKDGSWILPLETENFLIHNGIQKSNLNYEDLNENDLYIPSPFIEEVVKIPIEGVRDKNGEYIIKGDSITFSGIVDNNGFIDLKEIEIIEKI